ncbi:MAG: glycerophosphodiester phosphodiesterase [Sporichthyaceae bacterium]
MALRHGNMRTSARRIAAGTMLTTLATGSAVALGAPAAHAADGPELIAHRGGMDWSTYTENGTKAVENAFKSGADSVEIDVQWTKDGRTVVMHDKTMNRTTNCSGTVTTMNYSKYRDCKLEDGSGAPNIYDVLKIVDQYKGHVFLHVRELTTATKAKKLVEAMEHYGLNNRDRATVISTNKSYLEMAKKNGSKARRGYLFSSDAGWTANYSILLPYDVAVTSSKVKAAQKVGKKVMVVEGHPTKVTDVLDLKLDGFMANGLQKALVELGRALAEVTAQAAKLAN